MHLPVLQRKKPGLRDWLPAAVLFCATFGLSAQTQLDVRHHRGGASAFRPADIRTDVDMVLVRATVTNRYGTTIDGLPASSFTVLENKIPQTIVSFGSEDVPASIGVVVDLSGSMRRKANLAAAALHTFFKTANPEDEAFLLTVSSRPESETVFTRDLGFLEGRLLAAQPGGATALVDTIYLALQRTAHARNERRVLLVVSDGMDNHSRYSERDLMRFAEEADVQIYTIGVTSVPAGKKPIELAEEHNGLTFLERISATTGGLNDRLAAFRDAAGIAERISRSIRDEYLIGYRATGDHVPGKWRAIRVKVNYPQARVVSRTGYFAQ